MINTPQSVELKACPFCGEAVELVERDRLFAFRCPEHSPCFGSGMATYGKLDQRDTAIAAWNTRTTPAPGADAVERLTEALRAHWLTSLNCDPEAQTNAASCFCTVWRGETRTSIPEAVEDWIAHVTDCAALASHPAPVSGGREDTIAALQAEAMRKALEEAKDVLSKIPAPHDYRLWSRMLTVIRSAEQALAAGKVQHG